MTANLYINDKMLVAVLMQQVLLQQQLIEAQQQVIALQKQLNKRTPKNPKDRDIFWHLVSDGVMSTEAANSDDLVTVQQFHDWLVAFAKKHIRPYVNAKVYGECLNQMTRGLTERIADLKTRQEKGLSPASPPPLFGNGKRPPFGLPNSR